MEPDYLAQKVNRAISQKEKFGLNNATSWVGFQTTKSKGYTQSASGGILSTLLVKLLELNEIDGVLHAKQLEGNNNSPYFQAHLSKTIAEIHENRSSFYAPIDFSSALSSILSDDTLQSVAIVGTPCVISAIKRFYRLNTALKQKKILLFALVCGHNVNGQFADHLSNAIAGKNQSKRKLKFRDKEGISVASNFNNSVLFASGEKIAIDRFKSPFTVYWRTGAYALNGCNFCPDFWGEEADATFKDAWGISLIKKEGETAFAIKNPELIRLTKQLEQEGTIYLRQITNDKFATSQERTFYDKTDFIETRARHHQALKKNIDHKHRGLDFLILTIVYYIKQHIQIQSKRKFAKNRIYSPRVLKFLEFFIEYGEKFVLLKRRYNKKVKPTKEVIYTSGFGYRNIGDEAQLETNLQLWRKIAPEYKVTLLSPNPDYTRRIHGNFDILTASRNSFLGISGFDYLGLGDSRLFYPYYWLRKQIIWANAFMIKYLNRTIFIGPESSILLKRLKKADLLHIGGGGLFTGKTKSRLYDLSLLIRLAHYLHTNIILSGHNIGLWRNTQQKNALKKLKYAKIIGLRDNSGSIEALKKLRIYDQNKVIPLFDDALFCEGMPKAELEKHFSAQGINPNKKHIAINCYTTATIQKKVEEAIDKISAQLKPLSDEFEFIAISTHPVDEKINDYFRSKLPDTKILQHNDNTALVVSCFQHAHICITVRHHPIIFSMSGCVPTISFTFDDYYELKNFGALKLFGQGKQVFQYKKDTFKETFGPLLKRTLENRESISREIQLHLNEFSKNKGYIIKKYIEDYG
ncbi:polysaccharide pyruvyl transferase family protein [Mangrovibacterium marinum]|uniref:polysaccharide pyruvyl transferase family protein n=1 Tax=Mangrovibacterium marinum TaxID=1639118 RepID=UPI002A18C789|nr:polysaccharide pyruvyl transferase family protein [Mangrovibacterium marinum]